MRRRTRRRPKNVNTCRIGRDISTWKGNAGAHNAGPKVCLLVLQLEGVAGK